jgi:hypothetical protein
MQLTAVFESWHIGDGNYPPLSRDQLVRLSFELAPTLLVAIGSSGDQCLEHVGDGEYRGVARVLRWYRSMVVLETNAFRFYVSSSSGDRWREGDRVEFVGTLLLDHYAWVESRRDADAPDLFYNLRVERIRKVDIPKRFISRHGAGKSFPTRVGPNDFEKAEELATMEGQPFDEEFYVIDFDGAGLEGVVVPLTFIGVPPRCVD